MVKHFPINIASASEDKATTTHQDKILIKKSGVTLALWPLSVYNQSIFQQTRVKLTPKLDHACVTCGA